MRPQSPALSDRPPPPDYPPQTVEAWAHLYVTTTSLDVKRRPPPVPNVWQTPSLVCVPNKPGRPPELEVVAKVPRSGHGAISEEARARALHTFAHHELQAAELMAWAILRFRAAEAEFKQGLLRICLDEVRHLGLYVDLLERRGVTWGNYPVRDWFWQRVPSCQTPLQFVSLMGLGVEAANLEHASRFEEQFARHGDLEAAALQNVVASDEINHVAFGRFWFERWHGPLQFRRWSDQLPPPLSPLLMRALPLNQEARSKAGMNEQFLAELSAWRPDDERR